jgi:hypothetical protein
VIQDYSMASKTPRIKRQNHDEKIKWTLEATSYLGTTSSPRSAFIKCVRSLYYETALRDIKDIIVALENLDEDEDSPIDEIGKKMIDQEACTENITGFGTFLFRATGQTGSHWQAAVKETLKSMKSELGEHGDTQSRWTNDTGPTLSNKELIAMLLLQGAGEFGPSVTVYL